MSASRYELVRHLHPAIAAVLSAGLAFLAWAAPAPPNPCKLATVAEIEQILGKLKEPPKVTDEGATCTYAPAKGQGFLDVTLHDADLAALKKRNGGKNAVAVPEFGSGAFVTPDFENFAELYAKKGNLVLRVSVPKGPEAVEVVKAVARKALPRL